MDVILNGTGNNYNLHALILPIPGGTQTIPADADCAAKTYTSDPALVPPNILAPNGSSAGRRRSEGAGDRWRRRERLLRHRSFVCSAACDRRW